MPTNIGSLAWKADGGTASRTFAVRTTDVVNVKDWGATGDGSTDDRAAIQAAIDVVQGNPAAGADRKASAALYFPPGNYRCNTSTTGTDANGVLVVNLGATNRLYNFCMFGDNSATTRIFYDGTVLTGASKNTILLSLDNRVVESRFSGLHLDMTPATGGAPDPTVDHGDPMCAWNRGRQGNAGDKNEWFDIKCTGACFGLAMSGEGAALGSENKMLFCKFDDCYYGLCSFSANALGYAVLGGYAKNCTGGGIVAIQGGMPSITGVQFSGNATLADGGVADVSNQNANPMLVCGCTSTSQDFMVYSNGGDYILANYHHAASTGIFNRVLSAPNTFDANWSTNGAITNPGSNIYLRGNRFDNVNYLSGWTTQVKENI